MEVAWHQKSLDPFLLTVSLVRPLIYHVDRLKRLKELVGHPIHTEHSAFTCFHYARLN